MPKETTVQWPKSIVYAGATHDVLDVKPCTRSNDPLVCWAYKTEAFGYVVDADCEKVNW